MLKLSDLAKRPDFAVGPLSISPARRQVDGPGGTAHAEPLVMQVFLMLLDARGQVVTRDEIFQRCWGGDDLVGDNSLNRAITLVRRIADQAAPGLFEIENIPRTGYRLIGDIWPSDGAMAQRGVRGRAQLRRKPWRTFITILVLLAGSLAALVGISNGRRDPASIAVLPFRDLSFGAPYFGEGIGDEISVQLSREPQFHLVGRMSASQFKDTPPQEVGRRLNVEYVLGGSIRAQGKQIRVTAALVKTSDGVQLWSDNFDGNLDDVFAIQQQIGSAVAGALKRRLVYNAPQGSFARNGEAQNLYLTARGMLRERNTDLAPGAAGLLREAIRLDRGFAPAWSSLAHALRYGDRSKTHETTIAVLPQAERFARHSIRLDPERAEGYAVLGMLLGFASPEANSALQRAIELEPNNVEALVWLAASYRARGDFALSLAHYRRALELDPSWGRVVRDLAVSTAEMGDRSRADSLVARSPLTNEARNNMHGRIAWVVGDFSEAIRRWSLNIRPGPRNGSVLSGAGLQDALFEVGLPGTPLPAHWPPNFDGRMENRRVRMTTPPSPSVWHQRNRSKHAALIYQKENRAAAKLMLNTGRARELVATFDGPVGLLGMRPAERVRGDLLRDVPTVALALREVGRNDEANRFLREGNAVVRRIYRQGRVAFSFDADAAAIWAAQGRQDEALVALERAMNRGWVHIGDTDLKDIADEPGFASLRGHPRFERLRAKIRAHYQRERQEIARLRI